MESESFLAELNQRIRRGCTAHLDPNAERIYYLNHETRTSSWLPPVDSWSATCTGLPYGWEAAVDKEGRSYFINHVSKTTTYEDPRKDYEEEPPPCPREVELFRDPQLGFGFVAGSEKPVIVRFVTEGGPSEHKLQPGDQILGINGEDVKSAPREHVIELVKSCQSSVKLVVCQPHTTNTTRKSALLTAAKKAKLKSNPSRVRFAEGVVINGSPLYCPSTFESCVPFMPNVMKVFMENGQTKSFKYDSSTTVQDVLNSLQEKLSVKCMEHFGLVVEHIKSVRRNKLTLLDPKDSLAKIAARPGAHHLRCLFRVAFVPLDAYDLLQKDPVAFEYLYVQCCNDMVQERFAPELKYDVALRLAALHIQLHALSSGMQGKVTIKSVERECGLKRFVPASLLETMKRKELRKLLGHYLKQNQALSAPGQKQLTALQAKLHYLKIVGELPSYGAKCFSTLESETAILVSPKFGLSQINNVRSNVPTQPATLAHIAQLSSLVVRKDDDMSYSIEIKVKDPDKESLKFSLEDNEMAELVFILKGYHKLVASRDLPVDWEVEDTWKMDTAPCFHGPHVVCPSPWSYPPWSCAMPSIDLSHPPPPYVPCELPDRGMSRSSSREQCSLTSVDHNMNETGSTVAGAQISFINHLSPDAPSETKSDDTPPVVKFDIMDDDDEEEEEQDQELVETKNSQVLRRVSEMRRIVSTAENYLSERKMSDTAEPRHDRPAEAEIIPDVQGQIKAADSLLLLTQLDVQEAVNDVTVRGGAENESPSESDTDSFGTPNQSPLHRASRLSGAIETAAPRARSGSSFGLHSPDVLPGLGTGDKELLELLKKLQSNPDVQLPFAEGTLYLDPDIIDLTMIPPPMTPDTDLCDAPGAPEVPPTLFLDKRPSLSEEKLDPEHEEHVDSARVVAELDSLCNALTELRSSSDNAHYRALFEHLGCEDLDSFIATATIPPPPEGSHHCTVDESDDDIASYIIPPPPPSCNQSTEVQNQVLARFQRASEDIRRIMSTEEPGGDTSRHSAAMEPPMLESLKVCDALTNGGYSGLLVTDGESAELDEFPQRDVGLHYTDVAKANGSMDKPQVPPRLKKSTVNKKEQRSGSYDETEAAPRVARSLSWTNLQGQVPQSPKARKPPLPIQEQRGLSNSSSPRRLLRVGGSPQLVRKRSPARSASLGRAAGRALNGFAPLHPALNCLSLPHSDVAPSTCKDGPYARAQQEVYAMVMRLDQVAQTAPVVVAGPACKEALLAESRQFVTASKLFVKSATEASDDALDHLVTCVALLDRMFAAGEVLVVTRPTLCEQLKAVALAYARTVGTAGCGDAMSSLMCQATDLASALTTLMRTLRSVGCP
ncbi:uncharacterized protein LOC135395026 isoform X2 [Ornithodoros turicata]|uniref:uncharacterized protein LOC135395026 isoform X2 n=1 Tax=Ornithodoros turicata TaxID=34597 RepID=UPI00313862DB